MKGVLSDAAVRAAKPGTKPRKMFDGGGLFLLVTSSGSELWRLKYRHAGTERLMALGALPGVSLKAARDLRDENQKLIRQGIDPIQHRRDQATAAKQLITSNEVAERQRVQTTFAW